MGDNKPVSRIAVVIPSFRVTGQILGVLDRIGDEVSRIYVVDDRCPDGSGALVESDCSDERVTVVYHDENQGVGGATITGYRLALADGMDIVVKLDGDGQMDPALIPSFARPLDEGLADYTKGNRFYDIEHTKLMPVWRRVGNAGLSFWSKASSGYWGIFDPTNGYTAIHARVLANLPLEKLRRDFFFESDMLFRLGILGAVVADIPMRPVYGDEQSNLKITRTVPLFIRRHTANLFKRIVYDYFVRDFSVASLELVLGLALTLFGVVFGVVRWAESITNGVQATSGTVMLAALPVFVGVQLMLSFLNYDIQRDRSIPLHLRLAPAPPPSREPEA